MTISESNRRIVVVSGTTWTTEGIASRTRWGRHQDHGMEEPGFPSLGDTQIEIDHVTRGRHRARLRWSTGRPTAGVPVLRILDRR